ncbi:MAG: tryptophan 7-halogenase [Burkholderiales bacterium]|nr:tryptophan 7-halogenase [Burkholderiales bacterium]
MSGRETPVRAYDVIVIGGGPAGTTTGALLAERGWKVALFEKDRHPRFHIGESLLPRNNPLFARLGVLEEVRAIGIVKAGVEFNSPVHGKSRTFYFASALDASEPTAFQVHRSELDHILIRNAARKGVAVFEETRATAVDLGAALATEPGTRGVSVRTAGPAGEAEWTARFLVDASGRDTLLASRLGIKAPNRRHAAAAIYGHYEDADRSPGRDAGNISIYWFDHGWFWFIPLQHGITSVGAVCRPDYLKTRRGSLDAFLDETVALCPPLAARLARARRIAPVTATGNYSYEAGRTHGRNYLMVGDAFAFVDPVFSSGVYLAMVGAFAAADAVDTSLRAPAAAERAARAYEHRVRQSLATFSWFIYRMTTPAMRDLIMHPRNVLRVVDAMISFLAGDIYRGNGVRWRIRVFQLIYHVKRLATLRGRRLAPRNRTSDAGRAAS